ncbi:alpha/beta fold hydrolase [Pseudomonas sp. UL073]|uniref:Alpha/beta fold hydrolase n=1 Tax=Zestomonas insulae TaxID=2809017 RepID=A0ABS2IJH8_9GAMM|nr:alpha/beta fold hydrolase [Pseudomonas insulae]MBM7063216.1 alpha/beta fold hydrolase [Pseudomonas insulae]
MRAVRAALGALLIALAGSGCSLFKLQAQLDAAHQQLVRISGSIADDSLPQATLVALLDAQGKLRLYRIVEPGSAFHFVVPKGDYQLLAFIDRNGNFVLDPAEPRRWLRPVAGVAVPLDSAPQAGRYDLRLQASDLQPAPPLDLSLARLYREHPRLQRNYLQQVDFDDPRFSAERVSQGAWQPLDFLREVGYGLYLLHPWDAHKEPVFLVHGINDSPRAWRELIASLDPQRFQAVLFHYPSGVPLNSSAYLLSEAIRDVQLRHSPPRYHLFAHSMGGLVARRAAQMLSADDGADRLCLFLTLSTPWDGHPSAASGVAHAPVVAPVWRDLAPGSRYLQDLFASPLPAHVRQWQLVSYAGNRRLLAQPNDGVVPLASELRPAAQDEAEHLYLLRESHTSILRSARSQELISRALGSLPARGCRP